MVLQYLPEYKQRNAADKTIESLPPDFETKELINQYSVETGFFSAYDFEPNYEDLGTRLCKIFIINMLFTAKINMPQAMIFCSYK